MLNKGGIQTQTPDNPTVAKSVDPQAVTYHGTQVR